jgi:hypothetical protein
MAKDRTPAAVKAARKAKARRRLWVGGSFLALWWLLFFAFLATGMGAFLWAGWIAVSGEVIVLYGLHEKALRKIANRPEVDYNEIRKLEKADRKQVKAVAQDEETR